MARSASSADREGGLTPLYDAIRTAVTYTVNNSNNTNRVVIVFTDGEDTASTADLDDAVDTANAHNVPLHTIALASGVDMNVLSRLAGATGGALARASDAKRLVSYYGALGTLSVRNREVLPDRLAAHTFRRYGPVRPRQLANPQRGGQRAGRRDLHSVPARLQLTRR